MQVAEYIIADSEIIGITSMFTKQVDQFDRVLFFEIITRNNSVKISSPNMDFSFDKEKAEKNYKNFWAEYKMAKEKIATLIGEKTTVSG
jgi:hypothetical protein